MMQRTACITLRVLLRGICLAAPTRAARLCLPTATGRGIGVPMALFACCGPMTQGHGAAECSHGTPAAALCPSNGKTSSYPCLSAPIGGLSWLSASHCRDVEDQRTVCGALTEDVEVKNAEAAGFISQRIL
jgi:hypothetical protein